MANDHQIADLYSGGDYLAQTGNWHDDDADWKARHVQAILEKNGARFDSVADVGCGTGGVLYRLRENMGLKGPLTGFEIAEDAYKVAVTRAEGNLGFSSDSLLDRPEVFDLVLAMDVFEHVDDYLGFLRALRQRGRQFAFHIPLDMSARSILNDWPIEARRTVGHLHYFIEDTAVATLETAGYTVVDRKLTHAIMQPPPKLLSMKIRRLPHRLLYAVSPRLCAKILGGCSLLVYATA